MHPSPSLKAPLPWLQTEMEHMSIASEFRSLLTDIAGRFGHTNRRSRHSKKEWESSWITRAQEMFVLRIQKKYNKIQYSRWQGCRISFRSERGEGKLLDLLKSNYVSLLRARYVDHVSCFHFHIYYERHCPLLYYLYLVFKQRRWQYFFSSLGSVCRSSSYAT